MKTLIFKILVGMVFLTSCQKEPDYHHKKLVQFNENNKPVCVIWYKPGKTGWEVNKSWSDANEMSEIIALLIKAENPAPLNDKYKLSIIFYDGKPENLKLWEDFFEIRGGNYLGSIGGVSKQLGELLSKYVPEEVEPVMPIDPNRIKESQKRLQEESQKRLREEVKQLKEKATAEVNSVAI